MAKKMMNRQTWVAFVALFVGCNGAPNVASVTGRVTWNGEPLANASVQFLPIAPPGTSEAPGPGSTGVTDEKGNYVLSLVTNKTPGAVIGNHRVAIYTAFSSSKRGDGGGGIEKIPSKYNSATELTFAVKNGEPNIANWDLVAK